MSIIHCKMNINMEQCVAIKFCIFSFFFFYGLPVLGLKSFQIETFLLLHDNALSHLSTFIRQFFTRRRISRAGPSPIFTKFESARLFSFSEDKVAVERKPIAGHD